MSRYNLRSGSKHKNKNTRFCTERFREVFLTCKVCYFNFYKDVVSAQELPCNFISFSFFSHDIR